jgi:hypothetical protein
MTDPMLSATPQHYGAELAIFFAFLGSIVAKLVMLVVSALFGVNCTVVGCIVVVFCIPFFACVGYWIGKTKLNNKQQYFDSPGELIPIPIYN